MPTYEQRVRDGETPVAVLLWLTSDQRTVLDQMCQAMGRSLDAVVERILDDWAGLVAGKESALIDPRYRDTDDAMRVRGELE